MKKEATSKEDKNERVLGDTLGKLKCMKEMLNSLDGLVDSIQEGKTESMMLVTNNKFVLVGDVSGLVLPLKASADKSDVVRQLLEDALEIEEIKDLKEELFHCHNKYISLKDLLPEFIDENIEHMYKVLSKEINKGVEAFELVANVGDAILENPEGERKSAYNITKLMFQFLPESLVKTTGNKERDDELRKIIIGLIWVYGNMKFAFRVNHREEIQDQATKINDEMFTFIAKYMDKEEAKKSMLGSLVAVVKQGL